MWVEGRIRGAGTCFNEAPAERGGKCWLAALRPGRCTCFDEAPAERGGKFSDPIACRSISRQLQ